MSDFKIGDEVFDILKGVVIIEDIYPDDEVYIIQCRLPNGDSEYYTKDGRADKHDLIPALYHKGTKIKFEHAEPKR